MIIRAKTDYSNVNEPGRQIRHYCKGLLLHPDTSQNPLVALDRIRQLLEFIPLASDDFSVAVLRVENAQRYMVSGESGAAKFELRLFLGLLKQSIETDWPEAAVQQTDAASIKDARTSIPDGPQLARAA